MKQLHLVVGPNGSGKTTFVEQFLALELPGYGYVNADEIARARWPDALTHIVTGEASEALADLAESDGYDLLVMGNKGMSGLRRALGSVPTRVLKRAPTNVLIIHTTG